MTQPLISIIVPVYNVGAYLHEGLDSLCAQTYTRVQIILVNDGSTDESGQICHEYAARDNRIEVIDKENGGAGAARNEGLKYARGEFVMFFDPDDTMDADLTAYLYALWEKQACDLVCCTARLTPKQDVFSKSPSVQFYDSEIMLHFMESVPLSPWGKLYTRAVIGDLRFSTHYRGQDALFNTRYLCQAKSLCCSDAPKYYYRRNECSVSTRKFSERQFELLDVAEQMINLVQTQSEATQRKVRRHFVSALLELIFKMRKVKFDYVHNARFKDYLAHFQDKKHSLSDWGCGKERFSMPIRMFLMCVKWWPVRCFPFLFWNVDLAFLFIQNPFDRK